MNHKVCKTLSVSDGNYWWLIMPYQVQRVCWQSCGWYVNNIAKCVHLAPPGRWVIVSDRRAVLTTQIHSRQHLLGQRDSWVLSRYKQKQKHKYQKKTKNLHIGNSHQKGISRHKAQKSRVFINWQKFQPTSVFIFFFSFWIIYLDKFFEEYVIFIFRKLELRSPKLEQHNLWGGGTNCVKGGSIKDPFST